MNKKILIILIIVGVLVAGGGIYYFKTKLWCIREGGHGPPPVNPEYTWYQPKECCEGLRSIKNYILFDENCNLLVLLGASSITCTKCGDGKCGKGETKCNCPEDCKISVKDEVADWKTYRNEKYGFEVKHPANLELNSYESSPGVFTFQVFKLKTPVPIECRSEFSFGGSIFDKKIVSPSVIENIEKRHYSDSQSYTTGKIGDKTVTIEKKILGMCDSGDDIIWMEPSGRFVVLFHLSPSETDLSNDYKNIFNQIISTFKFTK